jgi:hypothetical protein
LEEDVDLAVQNVAIVKAEEATDVVTDVQDVEAVVDVRAVRAVRATDVDTDVEDVSEPSEADLHQHC